MREPNFKIDDERYGKFGEEDFKQYYTSMGYNVEDVSMDMEFRVADIDFIISKKPLPPKFRLVDGIFSRDYKNRDYYKFEVKTDTYWFKSRNVVFEVIGHDGAGGLCSSKADFIYYVFVDENVDEEVIKREAWSINLTKWRKYIREKFFDSRVTMEEAADTWGIKRNNVERDDINCANLLCNIEKLQEQGIAKKEF